MMCYKAQMLGQWDGFYVQCTTINHGFTHLDAFKVVAAPFSERFINPFFFSTGTGGTPKIQAQESLVDEIKNGDHTIGGS